MDPVYNPQLCEERHLRLTTWCEEAQNKMNKISNRFIILLTGLSLNLGVGIILLLIQLYKVP
jgi:hypothetical protein